MRFTKITITRTNISPQYDVNELLQWFGGTLGLFNIRDKDRSCFRIFIALLKNVKSLNQGLSSEELADLTNLSRGTIVHHLNKLMESGIVTVQRNRYLLTVNNLEDLVTIVQKDVNKTFNSLKVVGAKLDKLLRLPETE